MGLFSWLFGKKDSSSTLKCSECGKEGLAHSAMTHSFDGRARERLMNSIGQCPKCKRLVCGACSQQKFDFSCPKCRTDFVNL